MQQDDLRKQATAAAAKHNEGYCVDGNHGVECGCAGYACGYMDGYRMAEAQPPLVEATHIDNEAIHTEAWNWFYADEITIDMPEAFKAGAVWMREITAAKIKQAKGEGG